MMAAPLGDTASAARAALGGEAQGDFLAALAGLDLPEAAAQPVPASRPAMTPPLSPDAPPVVPTRGADVAPPPIAQVTLLPSPAVPLEEVAAPSEIAPVRAGFPDPEALPATSPEAEAGDETETATPAAPAPQPVAIEKPELAAGDPTPTMPAPVPAPVSAQPQPSTQGPVPALVRTVQGQSHKQQPPGERTGPAREERSLGQPVKRKEAAAWPMGDIDTQVASLDPAVAALDTVLLSDIAAAPAGAGPAVVAAVAPAVAQDEASMPKALSGERAGRSPTVHAASEVTAAPRDAADHTAPASRSELPAPATADPAVAEPRVAAPIFSQTLDAAIARHAAPPYPPAQAEPATATVALREGRLGTDVGVAIARALDAGPEGMREALLIRLDPHHMGRVDVRMSFDDDGTLRAVVSADSPAALDMLRRESAQLDRSLADAGVRSDAQSLRFDAGGNGAGGQHRHGARPQLPMPQSGGADGFVGAQDGGLSDYRSLRGSGHIDLMA